MRERRKRAQGAKKEGRKESLFGRMRELLGQTNTKKGELTRKSSGILLLRFPEGTEEILVMEP